MLTSANIFGCTIQLDHNWSTPNKMQIRRQHTKLFFFNISIEYIDLGILLLTIKYPKSISNKNQNLISFKIPSFQLCRIDWLPLQRLRCLWRKSIKRFNLILASKTKTMFNEISKEMFSVVFLILFNFHRLIYILRNFFLLFISCQCFLKIFIIRITLTQK